jgi:DivIVA domain-containing protein
MELTLKRLLEHAEFKKYRGKGYDPTEVDDFLDRATAMAGKVEVQLTQALEQAKAAGAPAPDPAAIEAEIERRVAEQVAAMPAPAASGPSEEETAAEAQRTLVMAQRTADAAVREARADADKLLAAAKEQADALLADAEARASAINAEADQRAASVHAEADALAAITKAEVEAEAAAERREARQRLAAEIGELEGLRESLRSDVSVLERHVEEQRSQLGSTIAELHQILDDHSGFRLAPAPTLADPELPDFSDLDEPEPEPVAEAEPEVADSTSEAAATEPDTEPEVEPEAPAAAAAPDLDLTVDAAPTAQAAEPAEPAEDASAAPPTLAFDEVDHEAPGVEEPVEDGPPTAPVSAVDLGFSPEEQDRIPADGDEDAFLTELRKAMADDQPLGPRDTEEHQSDPFLDDDDRRNWRFGRRR